MEELSCSRECDLVVVSNMKNERHHIDEWMPIANRISGGRVIIVDNGSTDGTIERARWFGAVVVVDDIIVREGYGPARNQLRQLAKKHFPEAAWALLLDADERIHREDYHRLRVLKDYLHPGYNAVAFPRIDWVDAQMTEMAKDWHAYPDFQCRMTRLDADIRYVRKLHEQVAGASIYASLRNPKLNHLHRSAPKWKRTEVGKVCAKLHAEDTEHGHTYPAHHKEAHFYDLYRKEGL